MCAKTIERNVDWWNEQPRPRQLLFMFCLLVANEENPAFHWDGESGSVFTLKSDGTHYYEMVPPPINDFRLTLKDLQEHFLLYEKAEIDLNIPLESSELRARIRLEQRDHFPHLDCEITERGDEGERKCLLDMHFSGEFPSSSRDAIHTTIHGKVLDHNGQPVSGVRLADRKINWRKFMMERVQPGDLDSNMVVFTNDQGEFELNVELTPGFMEIQDVVVVFKAPSITQWQEAEFPREAIESDPNVVIQLANPGQLKISFDLSDSKYAQSEQLQAGIYRRGVCHIANIEPTGELTLTGLLPGEYLIDIANEGAQIISHLTEVIGGEATAVNPSLTDPVTANFKIKITAENIPVEMRQDAERFEFFLRPDARSPWESVANHWDFEFAGAELGETGTYESSFPLKPMLGGLFHVYITASREFECGEEWTESEVIRLQRAFKVSGDPLVIEEVSFAHEFESGMTLEVQIEQCSS